MSSLNGIFDLVLDSVTSNKLVKLNNTVSLILLKLKRMKQRLQFMTIHPTYHIIHGLFYSFLQVLSHPRARGTGPWGPTALHPRPWVPPPRLSKDSEFFLHSPQKSPPKPKESLAATRQDGFWKNNEKHLTAPLRQAILIWN